MLAACILSGSKPAFSQTQDVDQQKTTISGTVINSVTHAPIMRALVVSGDNRYAMLTDSTGHFEFDLLDTGSPNDRIVWLSARKPGFLLQGDQQVNAVPGQDVTLPLTPEALIVGRVTLSTGDIPTGLTVQLLSRQIIDGLPKWTQTATSQPNSAGEFRFADLAPGSYKLVTTEMLDNDPDAILGGPAFGFAPVYYGGGSDFASASTLELTAGQTVQADLSLTRQPYYPVKIPLHGETSGPGVMIDVALQGHKGPGYSLGYNLAEHRIEGLLANGNYVVTVTNFGNESSSGTVNIKVAGGPVDGPAVSLIPNSTIALNLKEELTGMQTDKSNSRISTVIINGRPQPISLRSPRMTLHARVEPADDFVSFVNATERPASSPTDESIVLGAPPGRYWLRLTSNRGYIASATMGTADLLHQPLVIGPSSATSVDVVTRDDYATVEGSVSGIPTAEANQSSMLTVAWIYFVPLADGSGEFQKVGSTDGKFNNTLPPGSYRVMAFQHPHPNLPYRDPEAMRAYENRGQVIHLEGGQKTNLQLQLITSDE